MIATPTTSRLQLGTAFFGFILIGVASGAWGVLLPALSSYYRVNEATIGLLFFASAIGYFLSALSSGFLTARLGQRWYLVTGSALFLLCCLLLALKPAFALVLVIRLFMGIAVAMMEAGLNLFLTTLSNTTALLNYLHAFYGVGALLGPLIAGAILALSFGWNAAFFAWALFSLPLLLGLFTLFQPQPFHASDEERARKEDHGSLPALKLPIVWYITLFLLFYVGIEVSLGNWSYSFLLQDRHESDWLASLVVSGYWLGLTLGRFFLHDLTRRLHLGVSGLMYICMGGCAFGILIIWLNPGVLACSIAFCLVGTCLGPIYPSTVALLPTLVPDHLVASAMGFLIGVSILGVALFPWLAGVLAQYIGIWSLLPYNLALAVIMFALWKIMGRGSGRSAGISE
jgi:fucose permease